MSQALKVGTFVFICLAVLGYLIFKVDGLDFFGEPGRTVDVIFDSVAGLNEKAPVRVAGVAVGKVQSLGLEGSRARVTLQLDKPVPLTLGTTARIANAGILGDKYVELVPGPPDGEPLGADALLEGQTPVSFDQALARFDKLGQSLQELSGDVSARGDLGSSIRRLLDNLEATSADIRLLVSANREQVSSTVGNFERFSAVLADELPALTEQMKALLQRVDSVVAENRDDLQGSLSNIRQLTESFQTSVDNLNEISSQLRSGEGTIGKLIYDDQAHDSLVGTLDAVEQGVASLDETLSKVKNLQLELGLEGAVYPDIDEGVAEFSLNLSSHPKRFYYVGIGDSPQGRTKIETRTLTTTLPDGSVETTVIEERKTEDKFTIDAQLGYRMGDLTLRAGLIDSAAGARVDYDLFERRLQLSVEAFDFSRPDDLDPHLRLTTRLRLNSNIYLLGGWDDPLADDYKSFFIGAGIRWKDDDLKYLLGSVPLSF